MSFISLADLDVNRSVGLVWHAAQANPAIEALRAFAASHDWRSRAPESQISQRLNWAR